MSLADELTKLEQLRRGGTLTDEEFARAKEKLLAGELPANDAVAEKLGEQLAEVRYQNELARIDREWATEKEKFLMTGNYGRRFLPTMTTGWIAAGGGGAFGIFWAIVSFAIISGAPDRGGFEVVKVMFPVLGVVLALGAIAYGMYIVKRAEAYNRAYAAYRNRRAAVKPEDFR